MAYSAAEIKSAIDISRSQGFSDADIATGLGRYLPDAASVTAALAANPRVVATTATTTANTTAATTYTPAQIKSAIDVSRAQGFSDADIATGLGRYLPNATAVTTALADNPRPVATTTGTSTTGTGGTATTAGTGGTATTTGTGGTSTTGTGGTATTTTAGGGVTTYTPADITSAINISRQQGYSEADIAFGLGKYLPNAAAVTAALAANPRAATTTTTTPRVYTPAEIASAIAVSRQQGFSDADIATGLRRYLPDPLAVAAAMLSNPRTAATTTVARTYTPAEITSAINTSRQQGFSEADIATGLGRYLPNATAVTAALAANPKAATTATGATAGSPQGLLATGAQGFNPNISQPQRTYTSMTPASIGDTPITGTPYRNLYTPESVRQVYQSPQVMDAIRTSRAQGFNEADVRTGLLHYLSPQDADAAIAASLVPAPAAATGGLLSTATTAAAPNPYAAIRAATPAFAAPSSLNLGGTGGFDSSLYGQDKYKAPVAEVLSAALNPDKLSGGGGGGDRADTGMSGFGNVGNAVTSGLASGLAAIGLGGMTGGMTDVGFKGGADFGETGNFGGATAGDFAGIGSSPYAEGGSVKSLMSPNPPGPDDGYGSLQRGEYVIKKSAVDKYGEGLLGMINNGKVSARKLKSLLE